jgi:hypothetical protein
MKTEQNSEKSWASSGNLEDVEKQAMARGAIEIGKSNSYRYRCTCGFETKNCKFIGRGGYSKLAALQLFMHHTCK